MAATGDEAFRLVVGAHSDQVPDYEAGWIYDADRLLSDCGTSWLDVGDRLRSIASGHERELPPADLALLELIARGSPWRQLPSGSRELGARLYSHLAHSGVGEAVFVSGSRALGLQGYSSDQIRSVPRWTRDRFVGIGNLRLADLGAAPDSILDLGCGAGADSYIACALYPNAIVLGLDTSEALLGGAAPNATGRIHLVRGQAQLVGLASNSVDLIVANGLPPLLGASSMRPVLVESQRLLRREGELRFTTLIVGSGDPDGESSSEDVLNSLRCGKPLLAAVRSALAATGFRVSSVRSNASPFAEGFRPAGVHSVTISARPERFR